MSTEGGGTDFAVIGAALILGLSSSASAQDLVRPDLPELVAPACPDTAGIVADADIVTFPRTAAECVLGRLRAFGEAVLYVRLLEERLRLDSRRIGLRDRAVELAVAETDRLRRTAEEALARAQEAERSRDAWYRHPALWFGIGAVVTLIIEFVVLAAISPS